MIFYALSEESCAYSCTVYRRVVPLTLFVDVARLSSDTSCLGCQVKTIPGLFRRAFYSGSSHRLASQTWQAGRPRQSWLRTVEDDLRPLNFGLATARRRALIGMAATRGDGYVYLTCSWERWGPEGVKHRLTLSVRFGEWK